MVSVRRVLGSMNVTVRRGEGSVMRLTVFISRGEARDASISCRISMRYKLFFCQDDNIKKKFSYVSLILFILY
jgi:hypothetical protein